MFLKKGLFAVIVTVLYGCGGENVEITQVKPANSVPELNPMAVPIESLNQQNSKAFETHVKNGIYLRSQSELQLGLAENNEASSSKESDSFSGTTIQEAGVDEADRVKYDGEYLYIASHREVNPLLENEEQSATFVRIMQRENSGDIAEINSIVVNEEATAIDGLYLNNNSLAVLSSAHHYNIAASTMGEMLFPHEQSFNLSLVDVHSPTSTSISLSYTIDGTVVNSRRIGDILYIVSSFNASIDGIAYASTEQEKLAVYNKIMQTNIDDLLPKYEDALGNRFNLVDAESCYIPKGATELDGFDGIVTLSAINMVEPNGVNSVCINAQMDSVYASQGAMYLYGTNYLADIDGKYQESSIIHKFSLSDNSVTYLASGELEGRFNWNMSNLRFSEQGEYLRVVSTKGDSNNGFEHQLNIFSEKGNELVIVSQLPNSINAKPIGKVSEDGKVYEDVQAVRYYKDQAYVVTFENTDPLYVIDLKNNMEPVIRGELEVPGYSAFLQPISDNLLLGIGQNVEPRQNSEQTEIRSPIIEGAKVSLFDISDMTAPKEIDSIVFENAYTPVEFDYRALARLTLADDSNRFSLPIERWGVETKVDENGQKYDSWFNENSLALIEVSSLGTDALLRDIGRITADLDGNTSYSVSGWDDRSILHSDDIYYIHGYKVWHGKWGNDNQTTGPF